MSDWPSVSVIAGMPRRIGRGSVLRRRAGRVRPLTVPPGEMRQSVDAAIAAMRWLTDSDAAAIAQARSMATLVDAATVLGEHAQALRAHGQLTRLLDALGGTPRVRVQLELRSRKVAVAETDRAPEVAGNVSKFERPAKRSR